MAIFSFTGKGTPQAPLHIFLGMSKQLSRTTNLLKTSLISLFKVPEDIQSHSDEGQLI
jgi:hypothetical protein